MNNVFKGVVLPEKIGTTYLFPTRILGFDIGKTQVSATQLMANRDAITVEKFFHEPVELDAGNSHDERVAAAISTILKKADKFDLVNVAISSSLVAFKELTLPFMHHNQIALVLDFEVEPLLPFAAHDAIIDFIITTQHQEEQKSEILVAAVQKQHVAQVLSLFEQAGVEPDSVTVDLLALHSLYERIAATMKNKNAVLIDLGSQATRLASIEQGQLRLVRSLPNGMLHLAKKISKATEVPVAQALEDMVRFGVEKGGSPAFHKSLTKSLTEFWQSVALTLAQADNEDATIYLVGSGAHIQGLTDFVSKLLDAKCELLPIKKLFKDKNISSALKSFPTQALMSLSIALPSVATTEFNLRKKEFAPDKHSLLFKQLATGATLLICALALLFGYTFYQSYRLRTELANSKEEVIELIQDTMHGSMNAEILEDEEDLDTLVSAVERTVKEEERLLYALADPARASFLRYILELTERIDKVGLGFGIDRLAINGNTMTLSAHVRNYDALALLEKELEQSPLFTIKKKADEPIFTMEITLAKSA